MYEELVKRLRERAAWINFPHHGEEFPNEDAKLMTDAADAIEELSREIDIDNAAMTAMDAAMPRWIPVTERLPEDGDNVIVCTKSGNVGEAKYQAALGYDLDYPEIWFLLNDYGNQYQTGEIIAWMPLPQAPKEKT